MPGVMAGGGAGAWMVWPNALPLLPGFAPLALALPAWLEFECGGGPPPRPGPACACAVEPMRIVLPSKSARADCAHAAFDSERAEGPRPAIVFAPPFKRKIDLTQALKKTATQASC